MTARTLTDLDPSELENLAYDLARAVGFRSLTWRTPGADGGRDIEGRYFSVDASGEEIVQKWYIECKRYASAVSWPVVFEKVAWAKNHGADFLLMFSNSNPSPACENEIRTWNERESLRIRFWRGYQIEAILKQYPQLAVKYGLLDSPNIAAIAIQPLALILTSLCQSAAGAIEFNDTPTLAISAASAISELIEQRAHEIALVGRPLFEDRPLCEILENHALSDVIDLSFDGPGLRALLAFYQNARGASELTFHLDGTRLRVRAADYKLELYPTAVNNLRVIATLSNLELEESNSDIWLRRMT